jgi:anti-sigma regulatory factor (Ser/Thr protein kinase)
MEPLILPGTLDSLTQIGAYVLEAASQAGLERKTAYRLRLAVDEIATNSIVHGYDRIGEEGNLVVIAEVGDGILTIILEDTGPAYDPFKTPSPDDLDQPLDDRDIGGLGVFLAIQGVDEFRYERVDEKNRNIFTMKRNDLQEKQAGEK